MPAAYTRSRIFPVCRGMRGCWQMLFLPQPGTQRRCFRTVGFFPSTVFVVSSTAAAARLWHANALCWQRVIGGGVLSWDAQSHDVGFLFGMFPEGSPLHQYFK